MEALAAANAIWRDRGGGAELTKLERVGEVQIIAERRLLVVAQDDRIMGVDAHPLERIVGPALGDHRVQRDLGGRADAPALELGAGVDDFRAEEANGAEILPRLRMDDRRIE